MSGMGGKMEKGVMLTGYTVSIAREHAFCTGESFLKFVDAFSNLFESFIRFANFGECVEEVVAQAIEKTGWARILDLGS